MTDYIELHAHSNFSLLDGASSPEELVARAAALGMPALALTDHDAVYGAVPFCRGGPAGGHPAHPRGGNDAGRRRSSDPAGGGRDGLGQPVPPHQPGRQNAPKGEAALPLEALDGHTGGLIALSGCRQGGLPRRCSKATAERP